MCPMVKAEATARYAEYVDGIHMGLEFTSCEVDQAKEIATASYSILDDWAGDQKVVRLIKKCK